MRGREAEAEMQGFKILLIKTTYQHTVQQAQDTTGYVTSGENNVETTRYVTSGENCIAGRPLNMKTHKGRKPTKYERESHCSTQSLWREAEDHRCGVEESSPGHQRETNEQRKIRSSFQLGTKRKQETTRRVNWRQD